jgi:spermidine/putrescine transport system permease protein
MAAKSKSYVTLFLLAPMAIWMLILLILPLLVLLVYSFGELAPMGGYKPAFTLAQYANLPTRFAAFKNTMVLAPAGTLCAVIIAYPMAYYLARKVNPKRRLMWLTLIIVPFWTSLLIRTYAWMFILGGRGIPAWLKYIGIDDFRILNTPTAVLIGIVYVYLPLMLFPIFVSLEKLDGSLLEASSDLGASPIKTFLQVTLPMSLPGVATGCMLVFILLMGEFIIPAFLGGGKVFFIGNALVDLFLQSRNWPFGSAVAITLVVIMLIVVSLYMKLVFKSTKTQDVSMI